MLRRSPLRCCCGCTSWRTLPGAQRPLKLPEPAPEQPSNAQRNENVSGSENVTDLGSAGMEEQPTASPLSSAGKCKHIQTLCKRASEPPAPTQALRLELSSVKPVLVRQFSKDLSQAWTHKDSADNWSPVSSGSSVWPWLRFFGARAV